MFLLGVRQEERQSASGEQQVFGDTPLSLCLSVVSPPRLLSADGRQQDVFRKIGRVYRLT